MPKIYNEQFKADAVALVESGMSRRQVCADLGVRGPRYRNGSLTPAYRLTG